MNPPSAPVPTSTQPVKAKHAATISGWDEALRLLGVLLVGIIIWLIPSPAGVEPRAWHLLAIFVATIVGIIAKPLPMGAIAMIGIAATALTGTLTINQSLSGFGNSTIWLIVVAFFISRGFIKTGLGTRIAYLFMAALGKKTLGLSYGLIATDQQSHPLWLRPGTGLIWLRLRRTWYVVEAGRAYKRYKHSDLGDGRRPLVEIARPLVKWG